MSASFPDAIALLHPAICSSHGNYQTAGKARIGLLVALGAAVLDGGGIAWINFLLHIGPTL